MYCSNCGAKIDDNAKFCPSCGTPVKNSVSDDKKTVEESNSSLNSVETQQNVFAQTSESSNQNSPARPNVSKSWQRIFDTFDKANAFEKGYFRMNTKGLGFWEKRRITFSFLGFFFGPLYYLCKGLFLKAFLYSAFILLFITLVVCVNVILDIEIGKIQLRIMSLIWPVVFASFAKYDYYLYKCHGIKYIRTLPVVFRKTWFCILLNILSIGAYVGLCVGAVFMGSNVFGTGYADSATTSDRYSSTVENSKQSAETSQVNAGNSELTATSKDQLSDVGVTAADFNDYWRQEDGSYTFKLSVNDNLAEGLIKETSGETTPFKITEKAANCLLINVRELHSAINCRASYYDSRILICSS